MICDNCGNIIVGNPSTYLKEMPNKFFCNKKCLSLGWYDVIKSKIKPYKLVKTRTFIFPTNHSKYIYGVVSNYDRESKTGKTFVQKFYCMSHYIPPSEDAVREFTDEQQQATYHQQLCDHYMKVTNEKETQKQ